MRLIRNVQSKAIYLNLLLEEVQLKHINTKINIFYLKYLCCKFDLRVAIRDTNRHKDHLYRHSLTDLLTWMYLLVNFELVGSKPGLLSDSDFRYI